MMRKGVRILVVCGVLVAAVGYWAFRRYSAADAEWLESSGTIETTEVDVGFQVAGKVEAVLVREGEPVAQGQVIARLDAAPLREALERARAQLGAAQTTVPKLRAALEWTRASVGSREGAARAGVDVARARAQETRTGSRTQEIRSAEAALRAAEAALEKAKLDRERAAELVRRKVYAQAALDSAEAVFVAARAERDRAREALDLLREGSRREQIESSEAEVRQAQAGLASATADRMQIAMREGELRAAEARVEELTAAYNLANLNLDYAELRAPTRGRVLLRNIEPGEIVNVGTPVCTIGDLDDLWMNVYAPERSVGRVRLGDPVEIRVDAYETETFAGHVIFVSQEAEFTPKNIQTREERTKLVYRVKVAIANPDQKLKPGMPADARIRLHAS